MIDAGTHGAPSWVDLSTPDLAAATAFYAELLGWTVAHTDSPMGDYAIGSVDDFEVAGMMEPAKDEAGAPPMWTVFFSVDDVDAAAATAADAGGEVLAPPFDIPTPGSPWWPTRPARCSGSSAGSRPRAPM